MLVGVGLLVAVVWWSMAGGFGDGLADLDRDLARRARFTVDLNAADWPELAQLPGVGQTLARRIVESRHTDGPFRAPDDLRRVRGIGPKTLEGLRRVSARVAAGTIREAIVTFSGGAIVAWGAIGGPLVRAAILAATYAYLGNWLGPSASSNGSGTALALAAALFLLHLAADAVAIAGQGTAAQEGEGGRWLGGSDADDGTQRTLLLQWWQAVPMLVNGFLFLATAERLLTPEDRVWSGALAIGLAAVHAALARLALLRGPGTRWAVRGGSGLDGLHGPVFSNPVRRDLGCAGVGHAGIRTVVVWGPRAQRFAPRAGRLRFWCSLQGESCWWTRSTVSGSRHCRC